tara:strand:+ start:608 stop:709 length:102 start_codon:yes stop_codon:yes gene_type:complete
MVADAASGLSGVIVADFAGAPAPGLDKTLPLSD